MNTNFGIRTLLRRHLRWHGDPPRERAAAALDRVWERLEPHVEHVPSAPSFRVDSIETESRGTAAAPWRLRIAVAAVLVAAAVSAAIVWRPADERLFRVVEGEVHEQGTALRSNGGGGVLALADGSRIEMRSRSELTLERADDGMRIRLHSGGIIVNAAKQRTGHLYVQTKDMTVSVVGTVFLVNADPQGSRVAVIEGEVRVQQGSIEKKLRPGEEVATNPALDAPSVREAIAWSRNASALITLLQQSAAIPPAITPQSPTAPRDTFDVASIRPRQAPAPGGRGTGGSPCRGQGEIDPRRFVVTNTTLHTLIAWAHGRDCVGDAEFISGGPDWVRSDRFDLEARMPEGFPAYTMIQVRSGNAPRLQPLLQALLADRFKLTLHREMKERSVYVLTATARPTLTAWKEEDGEGGLVSISGPGLHGPLAQLLGRKVSMARLADALGMPPATGQRVLDRTGIAGEFNIDLRFVPSDAFVAQVERETGRAPTFGAGSSLFKALEEQLGLRLEAMRAPVETVVIDRVERPTEN